MLVEAVLALSLGDSERAEALLRTAPQDNKLGQYWLAEAYARLGRPEDATLAWRRAGAASYFLSLGHPPYEAGDYQSACLYYLRAAMIAPTNARAQMYAGHCYSRTGRIDEAVRAYRSAIDLDSRDGWSYVHLANRYSADLHDTPSAQAILKKCMSIADAEWVQLCATALQSLPQ